MKTNALPFKIEDGSVYILPIPSTIYLSNAVVYVLYFMFRQSKPKPKPNEPNISHLEEVSPDNNKMHADLTSICFVLFLLLLGMIQSLEINTFVLGTQIKALYIYRLRKNKLM